MAGLNAENLEQLRRWGAGLQKDPREEVAAAGRAILLLIEEVERLHVLVWDRRLYGVEPEPPEPPPLDSSLRSRLRRLVDRNPQANPAPDAVFPRDSTADG
jgi:hypothetical protein